MDRYNPEQAPDPETWLSLDEGERIDLIRAYHVAKRIKMPNVTLHAAFHGVVETQLAMPDQEPVRATLRRLMSEGLTRHETVHAIGEVLAEHMMAVLRQQQPESPGQSDYFAALRRLTAQSWRNG